MSLQIEALSHAYARGEAVLKELDLEFAPGITGLLGTNGAGKSTLISSSRPKCSRVGVRSSPTSLGF